MKGFFLLLLYNIPVWKYTIHIAICIAESET